MATRGASPPKTSASFLYNSSWFLFFSFSLFFHLFLYRCYYLPAVFCVVTPSIPFLLPMCPLCLLQPKIPLLWLSCFLLYTLGPNLKPSIILFNLFIYVQPMIGITVRLIYCRCFPKVIIILLISGNLICMVILGVFQKWFIVWPICFEIWSLWYWILPFWIYGSILKQKNHSRNSGYEIHMRSSFFLQLFFLWEVILPMYLCRFWEFEIVTGSEKKRWCLCKRQDTHLACSFWIWGPGSYINSNHSSHLSTS